MIEQLNKHLPLEINANVRYAGQAQILKFHGYTKLASRYEEAATEERGHADRVIRRIQQLGGWPDYTPVLPVKAQAKWDVKGMMEADLATETRVLNSLTDLMQVADDNEQDWQTFKVLQKLVKDTEDDIEYYTAQLGIIDEIGIQNYLAAQI
jgi:bacterioferritin